MKSTNSLKIRRKRKLYEIVRNRFDTTHNLKVGGSNPPPSAAGTADGSTIVMPSLRVHFRMQANAILTVLARRP